MQEREAAGGQAVLEGVMMRAGNRWALAVRKPDGEIHVEAHELPACRAGIASAPILRGILALGDSLSLGMRALNTSVEVSNPADGAKGKAEASVAMILGSALAIVLFVLAPAFLTRLAGLDPASDPLAFGGVDGILRLAILFAYVAAVSRLPHVRRVFAYHGAEHKAIHAWEAGEDMTVANARRHPRAHPRCGTSFLFLVTLVAFLVYLALPTGGIVGALGLTASSALGGLVALALRVAFLPVVAGVAYEILKATAARQDSPLAKAVAWPGIRFQAMTTAEPDDGMIEVALAALLAAAA